MISGKEHTLQELVDGCCEAVQELLDKGEEIGSSISLFKALMRPIGFCLADLGPDPLATIRRMILSLEPDYAVMVTKAGVKSVTEEEMESVDGDLEKLVTDVEKMKHCLIIYGEGPGERMIRTFNYLDGDKIMYDEGPESLAARLSEKGFFGDAFEMLSKKAVKH